jgi:tetratricopeptide (TPR) repeat protein
MTRAIKKPSRKPLLDLLLAAPRVWVLGLVLAAGLAGCQQPRTNCDEGMAVVDTDVMAFLSKARALHHEANVEEAAGNVDGAIASLSALVKSPIPRPTTKVPEIEEVLADTYARLADLRLQKGDLDGASTDVDAGLAHATAPTYFRGHLLEVQGILEEARAARLADGGKAQDAERARAKAVELLRQAVDIQDQVIRGTLAGHDGGKP